MQSKDEALADTQLIILGERGILFPLVEYLEKNGKEWGRFCKALFPPNEFPKINLNLFPKIQEPEKRYSISLTKKITIPYKYVTVFGRSYLNNQFYEAVEQRQLGELGEYIHWCK